MTPINPATDIPPNIDTLEKLALWANLALTRCHPNKKVLEEPDKEAVRVAYGLMIKADDGSLRYISRLSIPLENDYAENPKKFWLHALQFDETALPAAFKVV